MPSCLDAALGYAGRGWHVLALSPGAKIPIKDTLLQPNGSLSASKDPAHIRKLWETYPKANVGVATGVISGLTVIDLDGKQADAAIKTAGLKRPSTYTVKTPKGYHLYLTYDPALKQGARLLDMLDVRNDGGYVVAPPSEVGAIPYSIWKDTPVVAWPEITAHIATIRSAPKPASPAASYQSWVSEALAKGAPEGQRNDVATRLAGYFRSINQPKDITLEVMLGFAGKCNPPMEADEIRAVIDSVSRYTPSKPHTYQGNIVATPLVQGTAGNTRKFFWPESGIQIAVERISETRKGIDCLLTVGTEQLGELYGPIHFDLMSGTKRTELRRDLQDRLEADWGGIVQRVAALVRASLIATDDAHDMDVYQTENESPWLIEPIVKRGKPILLYGDGGSMKTTTAHALALSFATGKKILPPFMPKAQGRTLFLDFEADADDAKRTLSELAHGAGVSLPKDSLFYMRLGKSLADHYERIDKFVKAHEVEMIVVDSVVMAAGGDPFSPEGPLAYFSIVRELNVAALGISHIAGGSENSKQPRPYGSVYYWNWSRACWYMTKAQDNNATVADIGLFQLKANRDGTFGPYGMTANFGTKGRLSFASGDLQQDTRLSQHTSVHDQIAGWLRGGMKTRAEIEELMPDTRGDTIRKTLDRHLGRTWSQVPPSLAYRLNPDSRTVSGHLSATVRTTADKCPDTSRTP